MGLCVFRTEQVLPLAQHALNSPEHNGAYGEEANGPALFLVHDQGVYLMSNGSPRDTEGGQDGRCRVAYAEGCDPNVGEFDDWYGTSRDLVGGDDFVETLPLGDAEAFLRNCAEFSEFTVNLTPTQLDATFRNRRRRAKARPA
jgi:hypothetical protein